jgi:hypothetical protein
MDRKPAAEMKQSPYEQQNQKIPKWQVAVIAPVLYALNHSSAGGREQHVRAFQRD